MKVIYLVIIKQEDNFCENVDSFKKFISVDTTLSINQDVLEYKSNESAKCELNINVTTGLIESKNERYFKISLLNDKLYDNDVFSNICRKLKKIILRINPNNIKINTLWDDIGKEYAVKAYPFINTVENLMRQLITEFLSVNVGMNWSSITIHDDVQNKIKNSSNNNSQLENELSKIDFIQLSEVLFKKYRTISFNDIENLIQTKINNNSNEIKIDEVKNLIPISNWDRYFAKIIDYDGKKLQDEWGELYNLRNDVAHNRFIEKKIFEKIVSLSEKLSKVLEKTLSKLNEVKLNEKQKEEVLEIFDFSGGIFRLSQLSRIFKKGIPTIREFLMEKGYKVDSNPNTKVNLEMLKYLVKEYDISKEGIEDILSGIIRKNQEQDKNNLKFKLFPSELTTHYEKLSAYLMSDK